MTKFGSNFLTCNPPGTIRTITDHCPSSFVRPPQKDSVYTYTTYVGLSVSRKILWNPFSQIPIAKNVFWLVPPAVLVISEDISNFQDFLCFIKFIQTDFKRVSIVPELNVGKSQNRCAYHKKKVLIIPYTYLIFQLGQIKILGQADTCFFKQQKKGLSTPNIWQK